VLGTLALLAQAPPTPSTPVVIGGLTPPVLNSLSVTSGAVGTSVVLTGTTFSTAQGTSTVTFNGTPATPTAWSNTSITTTVPAGATTGPVRVSVSGNTTNGITFTVTTINPGCTTTAASLSQTDVQTALNAAAAGSTVCLPAGTGTWSTGVTWNAPANVTLLGAGNQSAVGGGNVTTIVDAIGSDTGLLNVTTNASGTFRMSGFTISQTGAATFSGAIRIGGSSHLFRMDHVHLNLINAVAMEVDGWIYGVLDHLLVDQTVGSTNNGIRINAPGWNGETLGAGDRSWNDTTTLGSERFLYIEDSIFNHGATNDCVTGGRFVFRFNTFTGSTPPPAVQEHGTGSGQRHRGCRAFEIYGNTLTAAAGNVPDSAVYVDSGVGVIWKNNAPGPSSTQGYKNFISAHVNRFSNATYPESPTPTGWGYCGTTQTGTPSNWDQNSNGPNGYACLDQLGRGGGDLLVNDFPNVLNNSTGTIAWPNQPVEPIYQWLDTWNTPPTWGGVKWANNDPETVSARDYYLGTGTTSVTGGVGSGTLAQRPASCAKGEAFWATDQGSWNSSTTNPQGVQFNGADGTLYNCTATNTWGAYYVPYTYPHPLNVVNTYTTSFPLTENPISEGGRWHHTAPDTTVAMTEVIGGVHVAHGTQTGVDGPNDSQAYLTGFGLDQSIQGTFWKAATVTVQFAEVELLLRWYDTGPPYDPGGGFGTTTARGYEINVAHDGSYVQLGHFKGPLLTAGTLPRAPVTGDLFRVEIHTSGANAIISAFFNNVMVMGFPFTDTAPFTAGSPGIGFYIQTDTVPNLNNQFGWQSITARDF
jgi:hypothetical protein